MLVRFSVEESMELTALDAYTEFVFCIKPLDIVSKLSIYFCNLPSVGKAVLESIFLPRKSKIAPILPPCIFVLMLTLEPSELS